MSIPVSLSVSHIDYQRIEQAMAYMARHVTRQPSLADIAAQVHLSPFHFQRLFCRWAGTTPKRFLQALTLERGKRLLAGETGLLQVSHALGLSGSSRLHDHFVQLEAITPGEYRNQGRGLAIEYGIHSTPFGQLLVAVTARGICRMAFVDGDSTERARDQLGADWPHSSLHHNPDTTRYAAEAFTRPPLHPRSGPLSLQVSGTNFQLAVWRALLRIPPGTLASYAQIASAIGKPTAVRAVGNAVGANPIALLIPCHRVIQQSGAIGGYRWGSGRKQMLQMWEQVQEY